MKTRLSVEFEVSVLDGDTVVETLSRRRNLILDSGLDKLGSLRIVDCFKVVHFGTGTLPTKRDSGAITFTRSGTTITASAAFFEAGDVGRLLKWDSGAEVYVTAYTSPTVVSCATGADIAAGEGTIWYVSRTALTTQAFTASTIDKAGDAAYNGTTYAAGVYTHVRTIKSAAVTQNWAITELGWSNDGAAPLFGCDVLSVPIALATGRQLRIRLYVKVDYTAAGWLANVAVGEFGAGGALSAGTLCNRELIASSVNTSDGGSAGGGAYENTGGSFDCLVMTSDFTLGTPNCGARAGSTNRFALAPEGYVSGTFKRRYTATIPAGTTTGTWYGIGFNRSVIYVGEYCFLEIKFATPWTKNADQKVTLAWEISWGRQLVN